MPASNLSSEILTAALEGLEVRRQRIEQQISAVRSLLRQPGRSTDAAVQQPRKRILSAEARKRIAAAQRKRWATAKKAAAEGQSSENGTRAAKKATKSTARKRPNTTE
jgi:hypothetical protein